MRAYKIIYILILFIAITINIAQEVKPEITLERRKLVILSSENENDEMTDKIYQITSSAATQLKRYDVIDRSQLEKVLKEQRLQHSGVVDQDHAVELGKIAAANGQSQWISGDEAREEVHRIRAQNDAIMIGIDFLKRPFITICTEEDRQYPCVVTIFLACKL